MYILIDFNQAKVCLAQGSPTFWNLRATSWVPINAKGCQFDIHF